MCAKDFSLLGDRPGYLIRRLHQIHVGLFLEECAEYNLTPVQFGVLTVLSDDRELDQISIATELGVDRNTTADVIRRLERRGLLTRPESTADKRTKLARITPAGLSVVEQMQPQMIEAQKRLVGALSEEEYASLMSLMNKLVNANNDASRAPMRKHEPQD